MHQLLIKYSLNYSKQFRLYMTCVWMTCVPSFARTTDEGRGDWSVARTTARDTNSWLTQYGGDNAHACTGRWRRDSGRDGGADNRRLLGLIITTAIEPHFPSTLPANNLTKLPSQIRTAPGPSGAPPTLTPGPYCFMSGSWEAINTSKLTLL